MTVIMMLFTVLVAVGLFFIFSDLVKLPYLSTARAMLNISRAERKSAKATEVYLMILALKIAKYIRISTYKKNKMIKLLRSTEINLTPEVYIAYAIAKSCVVMLTVIPCFLIFPMLVPVIVILAVMIYFKELKKADTKFASRRKEIENELPRFVSNIKQELKSSRDVLHIIENFKKNAGKAFVTELDILAADMRSGSYEVALTRFEARVNSPMLSNVSRGLIGVLRGDDNGTYFQMLEHDFKQLELQRLKSQAQKVPPKIRVFSFIMLGCFLLTYLIVIILVIMDSLNGMF